MRAHIGNKFAIWCVLLLCGHKHFTMASICNRLKYTAACCSLFSFLLGCLAEWFQTVRAKQKKPTDECVLVLLDMNGAQVQTKKTTALQCDEIPLFDVIRNKSHFQWNIPESHHCSHRLPVSRRLITKMLSVFISYPRFFPRSFTCYTQN